VCSSAGIKHTGLAGKRNACDSFFRVGSTRDGRHHLLDKAENILALCFLLRSCSLKRRNSLFMLV
jgi:hypothetical protein